MASSSTVEFDSIEMASSSTPWEKQTKPENAFALLEPYFAATSTRRWDMFINHCGHDVKYTLATAVYEKLHSMGFEVFLDKEALESGDSLPAGIQHAITSATHHIAIFSPNYAQSPWCLAELSFMLRTGAKVIPIFYHVDPSDLRWVKKGKYADAFSKHEEQGRYKSENLDDWKRALHDSSLLSGYQVNNKEDEAIVLQNIVNLLVQITQELPLSVADHPIGLDELVRDFESVAREEKVKITGIVGMGGSGKTTLAKELFNRNILSFKRRSFFFGVRDAASRNALLDYQKKLLADLDVNHLPFDTVEKGKVILAYHLSSLRVLVVLDDVDNIDQLNALLPNKGTLESESMVIVTTRELGVLKSWGLSCIYQMPALCCIHARQLFCWHAFFQSSPPAEFENLVEAFVKACNGLPLSLKLLGAQLYGRKSKDYWVSQLNKILRILPSEIGQRLQVSYDCLDEEEREMFLDIACFLIGERESTAIALWDGSGWSGLCGLETLVHRCLVDLVDDPDDNGEKIIRMHDHLRDMGREIASSHSSYRLWCPEQINKMKHSTKRNPIRGIQPADTFVAFKEYTYGLMRNSGRQSKRLRFSNEVRILFVEGNEFTEEFASLSEDLVWLRWEGFPLRCLPSWLMLRHLSVLEIHGANELEVLWQDDVDLPFQLRQLIILGNEKLQWLPSSIGRLSHLKTFKFSFHGSTLPEDFCNLRTLRHLALSSTMLHSLPAGFGNLRSLQDLNLRYCKQLSKLPDSVSELIYLKELNLSGCEMLSSLPDGFGNLVSLRNLNLENCRALSVLPDSLSQLIHLKELNLSGCEMLSSLPAGFENLINLRNLNLKYCKELSMLNLGNLTCLQSINLELSKFPVNSEQSLHASFRELDEEEKEMFLDVACFLIGERKNTAIALWDGSGWNGLLGLERLVNKCLVELVDDPDYDGEKIMKMYDHIRDMGRQIASRQSPYRIWSPEQIIHMKKHSMERKLIRGILAAGAFVELKEHMHQPMGESSGRYQNLRFPTGLKILSVQENEFTEELASLSHDLVWLRWEGFPLRNLPSWLQLQNLSVLELHGANEMEELWQDQEHAPLQLRELIITGTRSASFERFPSSISYLKILKKIALLGGVGKEFGIKELPEEFCDLQSLEHLELRHCILLSSLPARFGDLRNLRHLDLCFCKGLRMLPVSFQQLTLLNYLDLSDCKRLLLQKDILENITNLKKLYLSGCLALQKLPHQITDQACLRELRLQHTHLKDLPSNIGQLSKLEVLTIGSPLLKRLPDSLGNLSSLKSLSITDCFALECLPKTLGNLVLLEHLCIEATGVRSLPEGFTQLANLRTLKISDCPLSELDFGSVSSFSLEKLTQINLSETLVTRISISQHCCPRLETLQLSKNDKLVVVENLPATVKKRKLSERETLDIKGIRALQIPLQLTISDCPRN